MGIFRRRDRQDEEEKRKLAQIHKLKEDALKKIHHANDSSQRIIEVINERGGVAEAIYYATGGQRRGR